VDPIDSKASVLLGLLAAELDDHINVLQLLYEEHIFRDALGFRRVPLWVAIQAIEERDELVRREAEEEAES
jgi:hypothetical protein